MIGAKLAQPHSDELKTLMTARREELKAQRGGAGARAPRRPAPGARDRPERPRGPKRLGARP